MRPRNIDLVNSWNRVPLMRRLEIIAASVVNGEQAQQAVMKLIEICGLMASMLNAEARVAIAEQLRDEADALAPLVDRRLH